MSEWIKRTDALDAIKAMRQGGGKYAPRVETEAFRAAEFQVGLVRGFPVDELVKAAIEMRTAQGLVSSLSLLANQKYGEEVYARYDAAQNALGAALAPFLKAGDPA